MNNTNHTNSIYIDNWNNGIPPVPPVGGGGYYGKPQVGLGSSALSGVPIDCEFCLEKFGNRADLRVHLMRDHNIVMSDDRNAPGGRTGPSPMMMGGGGPGMPLQPPSSLYPLQSNTSTMGMGMGMNGGGQNNNGRYFPPGTMPPSNAPFGSTQPPPRAGLMRGPPVPGALTPNNGSSLTDEDPKMKMPLFGPPNVSVSPDDTTTTSSVPSTPNLGSTSNSSNWQSSPSSTQAGAGNNIVLSGTLYFGGVCKTDLNGTVIGGCAWWLTDRTDTMAVQGSLPVNLPNCTLIRVEYEGLLNGLKMALLRGFRSLIVRGSSETILNHLFEETQAPYYRSLYPNMSELKEATLSFFPQFERLEFELISIEQNQFIDQIAETTIANSKRLNINTNGVNSANAFENVTLTINRPMLSHGSSLDSSSHSFIPRGLNDNINMPLSNNTNNGSSNTSQSVIGTRTNTTNTSIESNEVSLNDAFSSFSLQGTSPPFYPQQPLQLPSQLSMHSQNAAAIRRSGNSNTGSLSGRNNNNIDTNSLNSALDGEYNTSTHGSSTNPFTTTINRNSPPDTMMDSIGGGIDSNKGGGVSSGYMNNDLSYEPFGSSMSSMFSNSMKVKQNSNTTNTTASASTVSDLNSLNNDLGGLPLTSSLIFGTVNDNTNNNNNNNNNTDSMFGNNMGPSIAHDIHNRINQFATTLDSNDPIYDTTSTTNTTNAVIGIDRNNNAVPTLNSVSTDSVNNHINEGITSTATATATVTDDSLSTQKVNRYYHIIVTTNINYY